MAQTSAPEPPRAAFRSLAARLGFFVFGATLISAFAVALTSAYALRGFLRTKVEQKLPSIASQLGDRVELWYGQRTLDVQVFARSSILVDGLARRGARALAAPDRVVVEKYLGYVLDDFPQYSSIFVLARDGELVLAVGRPFELDVATRERLAQVGDTAVSGVLEIGGERVQVISSSVLGRDERPLATLHGVLSLDAIALQLGSRELGLAGRIFVLGSDGAPIAASPGTALASYVPAPGDPRPAAGGIHEYEHPNGMHVVRSATPLERFGWTLVVEEPSDDTFAPIATILQRTALMNLGIVLVLSLAALRIAQSIVQPIRALSDCARRLRDGELDVTLPVASSRDEVGILTRTVAEMVERLQDARVEIEVSRQESENANRLLVAQNHELQRANETLEQLAITDGLTKIHNHRYFQDQLTKEIKRTERTGAPLSLVLLDIDDFKQLNDRHGHAVGDAVLQRLSSLLIEGTRDHDLVARYGGEEFVVLAVDTDLAGATSLAEKLRAAVSRERFRIRDGEPLSITVSMGVATFHGERQAFFREADRALYEAKAAGKDCVVAARPPSE